MINLIDDVSIDDTQMHRLVENYIPAVLSLQGSYCDGFHVGTPYLKSPTSLLSAMEGCDKGILCYQLLKGNPQRAIGNYLRQANADE